MWTEQLTENTPHRCWWPCLALLLHTLLLPYLPCLALRCSPRTALLVSLLLSAAWCGCRRVWTLSSRCRSWLYRPGSRSGDHCWRMTTYGGPRTLCRPGLTSRSAWQRASALASQCGFHVVGEGSGAAVGVDLRHGVSESRVSKISPSQSKRQAVMSECCEGSDEVQVMEMWPGAETAAWAQRPGS